MADLAKYVVSLEAETAKYRRELEQKANKQLDKFNKVQTRKAEPDNSLAFESSPSLVGQLAFGVLAGSTVLRGVRNLAQTAENLDLVATRLNVSARELQAWQAIGERFGVQSKPVKPRRAAV